MTAQVDQRVQDIRASLETRYGTVPPGYYIGIHTIAADAGDGERRITNEFSLILGPDDLDTMAEVIATRPQQQHVYSRMTALKDKPRKGRGTEDAEMLATCAWVDCDVLKNGLDFQQVHETLQAFTLRPTAIEFSGGGYYAFWRFTEPLTDWRRLKRINTWLASQLSAVSALRCGADLSTTDAARVLRLAGTFNAKPNRQQWATVIEQDLTRTYSPDQFGEETVPEQEQETFEEETIPEDFLMDVRLQDPYIFKRMYKESTASDAGAALRADGHVCRHKNDLRVAMGLLRLDVSPGVVCSCLTHPTWFCGSKFREEHNISYVHRTVAKAQSLVRKLSDQCFNGKKPIPARIGFEIMADFSFLWHGGTLYVYESDIGYYTADGELFVRSLLQERLGDLWTPHVAHAVVEWIKIESQSKFSLPAQPEPTDWLCVRNGMLNLTTRVLLPHSPQYRALYQVPVEFNPWVDKGFVDKFVRAIVHDDDLATWWQAVGYCLLNHVPYKTAIFLYGPPDTGKSALLNVLLEFVGRDNAASVSPTDLAERFSAVSLIGKMVNIVPEIDTENVVKMSDAFKKTVDGSLMEFERKGQPRFPGVVLAKTFLAGNQYPRVLSGDAGFYRRFHIIHCENVFTEGKNAQPMIARNLAADPRNMSAFLNMALDGLASLRACGGFIKSERMKERMTEMRMMHDSVLDFWMNGTVEEPNYTTPRADMYEHYVLWCKRKRRVPVSHVEFGRRTDSCVTTFKRDGTVDHEGQVPNLIEARQRDGQRVIRVYKGRAYEGSKIVDDVDNFIKKQRRAKES